eukprot:gene6420-293_t
MRYHRQLSAMDGSDNNDASVTPPAIKQMVEEITNEKIKARQSHNQMSLVIPKPGFCVKTDTESGEKVFLNICHADEIPAPPSISDEELALVIANEDNSRFRIPMSVGEPHMEPDHAGVPCKAIDAAVNSSVLDILNEREGMREFVVELVMCQVEAKYQLVLNREYKLLKRRKSMGTLQAQLCRSRRVIQDISKKQITTHETDIWRGPQPEYKMHQEPEYGTPDYLVFEFQLTKLKSTKTVSLDVGDNRIVLHARPDVYYVDIELKWIISPRQTTAQFNRRTHVLTVVCVVDSNG